MSSNYRRRHPSACPPSPGMIVFLHENQTDVILVTELIQFGTQWAVLGVTRMYNQGVHIAVKTHITVDLGLCVHVSMCVCMYVCMCVCVNVCVYVCQKYKDKPGKLSSNNLLKLMLVQVEGVEAHLDTDYLTWNGNRWMRRCVNHKTKRTT